MFNFNFQYLPVSRSICVWDLIAATPAHPQQPPSVCVWVCVCTWVWVYMYVCVLAARAEYSLAIWQHNSNKTEGLQHVCLRDALLQRFARTSQHQQRGSPLSIGVIVLEVDEPNKILRSKKTRLIEISYKAEADIRVLSPYVLNFQEGFWTKCSIKRGFKSAWTLIITWVYTCDFSLCFQRDFLFRYIAVCPASETSSWEQ